MKNILVPHPVADECTLIEALYWVAFNIYPLSEQTHDYTDIRVEQEFVEEWVYEKLDELDAFFTSKTCEKYGLPNSPVGGYIEENLYHPCSHIPSYGTNAGEIIHKDLRKNQEVFTSALDDYLDIPKSNLFVQLKNGVVKSFGRAKLKNTDLDSYTKLEDIDKSKWRQAKINWEKCTLETDTGSFVHILIHFASLVEAFPEPVGEAVQVSLYNGVLLTDESIATHPIITKKGRPAYNWKEFTTEVAIRFKNNELPKSQKVFIGEMEKWCLEKWSARPSETNLKEHISPFYAAMKKSENI